MRGAGVAKLYRYVGPHVIRKRAVNSPPGTPIRSVRDLLDWIQHSGQEPDHQGLFAATFVIDEQGIFRVANRHSEHVACAGGGQVMSAGEMFFRLSGAGAEVVEASNQSTGYCPEPESWPVVASALDRIAISHPGRFTQKVIFQRCPTCRERNIVKDEWYTQPIRYEAVEDCLEKLVAKALELSASVHMPRIGCGLAGGKWERIEPLIVKTLCRRDVPVTVYDF